MCPKPSAWACDEQRGPLPCIHAKRVVQLRCSVSEFPPEQKQAGEPKQNPAWNLTNPILFSDFWNFKTFPDEEPTICNTEREPVEGQ